MFVLAKVVLQFLATVVLGLERLKVPDAAFWKKWSALTVIALGVVALVAVVDGIAPTLRKRRAAQLDERRRKIESVLKGALVQVQEATGIDYRTIGVHAFFVEKRWRPWPWPLRYEFQKHAARFKMTEYPAPTGIRFIKGKGVVGRCWELGAFVRCDLSQEYAARLSYDRETWDRLSAADRFGLSFEEFSRTKDEAGVIVAAPMKDSSDVYAGCISLDAPPGSLPTLDTLNVRRSLQLAAHTVMDLSDP